MQWHPMYNLLSPINDYLSLSAQYHIRTNVNQKKSLRFARFTSFSVTIVVGVYANRVSIANC